VRGRGERAGIDADELFRAALEAGESIPAARELLRGASPDDRLLLTVLRRPVPARLLEFVGTTAPWCEDSRLLAAIVLNPRAPRVLALRLLTSLPWRDQAEVAASPRLSPGLRSRAESLLADRLPDLRLGDRISLARLATPSVLRALLQDPDARVLAAALGSPRLAESALVTALSGGHAPARLLEAVARSWRWTESYAVRRALVMQPCTPLGVALAQLSGLARPDLRAAAGAPALRPLVRAVAARLLGAPAPAEFRRHAGSIRKPLP
jgi:hypothetical protein